MVKWLDENNHDYKNIAIDNQFFPSPSEERASQIEKSPHTMTERRALILKFCDKFNMPSPEGVPEAIRVIGEWKTLKKH